VKNAFDKVLTSEAINEVARRVTSEGDDHDELRPHGNNSARFLACPELKPLPDNRDPEKMPDWTGHNYGELKVIGYYGTGGRWVVRCSCGIFELRKTGTIRKGRCPLCAVCRYRDYLSTGKKGQTYEESPQNPHRQ
jgi:hypothetical protein